MPQWVYAHNEPKINPSSSASGRQHGRACKFRVAKFLLLEDGIAWATGEPKGKAAMGKNFAV